MLWIQSSIGLIFLSVLAWLFSENHKIINWKAVLGGILLQLVLAFVLLKMPLSQNFFLGLNQLVQALEVSTREGTSFVFGYLGGGPLPFKEEQPGLSYILAFRGLFLILIMSALSSLLFYWKLLPWVVRMFAWLLQRTLGVGGVEGLGTAANIFVGMVEAPLLVRPYLAGISRSELFTIMVSGMATIAGTVMVLYASILSPTLPGIMGHLLIASLISAPASVVISKLMVPETSQPSTGKINLSPEASSAMDAIARGTVSGVQLLINVVAMLVVLVALVHLINLGLGLLPHWLGAPLTFQRILGWLFAPVMWLIGIPWPEAALSGSLMGTKTVLNELIAYMQLAQVPLPAMSDRTRLILTYAMCGFANFGSLGIMIGGMGAMVPARYAEIVALGIKSIIAGTLATCMTGAIIGLLY